MAALVGLLATRGRTEPLTCVRATIILPMTESNASATHGPSKKSEVEILTDATQGLAVSADRWNNAYIIGTGVAVLFAFIAFVLQFKTVRKTRDMAVSQTALIAAKDRELASDLKQKDGEIAKLNVAAVTAADEIAKANERAETARASAAAASERLQKMQSLRTLTTSQTDTLAAFLKENLQLKRKDISYSWSWFGC